MEPTQESFFKRGIGRYQYFIFWIIAIVVLGVNKIVQVYSMFDLSMGPRILYLVIWILAVAAMFVYTTKRLRNMGRSSWFSLILLVPLVNLGFIIYLLLAKGTTLPAPDMSTPQVPPVVDRQKDIKNAIVAVVLIAILWFPFKFLFLSGVKQSALPNDPLLGRTFTPGLPLVYVENCTKCGFTGKAADIDRQLMCPSSYDTNMQSWYLYDTQPTITYVPTTMTFKVKEVVGLSTHGIMSIDSGTSQSRLAILEDTNGVLSTRSAVFLEGDKQFCFNPDEIAIPPYRMKLFKFVEQKGRTNIEVALFDPLNGSVSSATTQDSFINSLPKNSHFSDMKKVDSTLVPGLKGVRLSVDADGLAFIISSETELNVWEITGLDDAYQKSLTVEDRAEMKTSLPWGFKPAPASGSVTLDVRVNGLSGPVQLVQGKPYTLSWNSTNANVCKLVPPGNEHQGGEVALHGELPIQVYDAVFYPHSTPSLKIGITCSNTTNTASDSVTVIAPK